MREVASELYYLVRQSDLWYLIESQCARVSSKFSAILAFPVQVKKIMDRTQEIIKSAWKRIRVCWSLCWLGKASAYKDMAVSRD